MKTIYFAHWHKDTLINVKGDTVLKYPKNSISLLAYSAINLAEMMIKKGITVYPANHIYKPWRADMPLPKRLVLFLVDYGIGDHLAMSSLFYWLEKNKTINISVFVAPREFHIYKWFKSQNFTLHDGTGIIMPDYSIQTRLKNKHTQRLEMEWAAVDAGSRNWYDAIFERAGIVIESDEWRRPHISDNQFVEANKMVKSVLITHSASCQIRSSRFQDFYIPVKRALPDYQIFVNQFDLVEDDLKWIEAHKAKVNIVKTGNAEDYLSRLRDYSLVVTTDSAPLHFREGLGLPAIAAFSAMTAESRASAYKHTHSINIKSDCPLAPCFQHGSFCSQRHKNEIIARCITGEHFQEQLYEGIKGYWF